MSDNVIVFPKSFNHGSYLEQLKGLQAELNDNYQRIMENYMLSRALELESSNLQEKYDKVLMQYAEFVGHENVPVGLMEYSTHICRKEGDEIEMVAGEKLDEQLELLQANVRKTMDELANYLQGMNKDELQ